MVRLGAMQKIGMEEERISRSHLHIDALVPSEELPRQAARQTRSRQAHDVERLGAVDRRTRGLRRPILLLAPVSRGHGAGAKGVQAVDGRGLIKRRQGVFDIARVCIVRVGGRCV